MKEWKNAEIVELDISETELDLTEGEVIDGVYQDCSGQWFEGYS